MASPQDKPKLGPFFILGAFFLLFLALPASWKVLTQSTFDEFQAPLWEMTSRLSDLKDYWGHLADSKKTLVRKNRDLSRIRTDWDLQVNNFVKWENEIAKLKALQNRLNELQQKIGLDAQKKYRPILARVTQRNLSSWWQELSLRKGAKEQIYSGQGVIFSQGIIGRIYKSGKNYSTVELATNPNFRIVAHFQGDNRPVTFQGSGIVAGGKPMGVVLDVPHDIYIQRNQNLILETSALGGTFPGGLNIGVVRDLEESGDGLFKTGNVFLPNGLAKVSEVTILSSQLD